MWESIVALAVLGGKIVYDHVASVRSKADDLVRVTARAIIPRVIAALGDDRERAYALFSTTLISSLDAVGVHVSNQRLALARAIFDQLWDAHARGALDDGLAALGTAGAKAAKVARWLEVFDPFASLRGSQAPGAVDGISSQARLLRERGKK